MTGVKAIETHYAGCRFRSRLEARWAVAFDHLGIPWQYEAQGFHLPSGDYLPDFKIGCAFVEIKGPMPNAREFQVASEINLHVGPLVIFQGDLPRRSGEGIAWAFAKSRSDENAYDWTMISPEKAMWALLDSQAPARLTGWDDAMTAGRSARFEHGETPVRSVGDRPALQPVTASVIAPNVIAVAKRVIQILVRHGEGNDFRMRQGYLARNLKKSHRDLLDQALAVLNDQGIVRLEWGDQGPFVVLIVPEIPEDFWSRVR